MNDRTEATTGGRVAEISGVCEERFAGVRDALAANLDKGLDTGASVAVFVDGVPAVDIWAGSLDDEGTIPWERDTITNVWSITKTMAALCCLILADRGELDFSAPVARYWPEFAAAGKGSVLVRHLLGHTAGLSGWSEPITSDDLTDWDKMTSLLAAQEPWWEPGTQSGYHALTQGYLVGEVVRRITGVTLGTFFATEVTGPLDADFHIGLPAADDHRVAPMIPPVLPEPTESSSIAARTLLNPRMTGAEPWKRPGVGPRSRRPTDRATPVRWPASSRWWPGAARWAGCGCSRPGAARPFSRNRPTVPTSSSGPASAWAWATDSGRR